MKKTLLICALALYSTTAFSSGNVVSKKTKSLKERIQLVSSKSSNCNKKLKNADQRSGCCSWHKGVCGCSGGRAYCCDGTLSPSCGCD
ncbi:MAG: hypothetical protein ACTSXL_05550 [Alphaproteobacteria bacterium]|nr:MAG: hypothetical protein B6I23_02495 [Rickettsiaceae bacterium 4572_127]